MVNLNYVNTGKAEYFTFNVPCDQSKVKRELETLQELFAFSEDKGGGVNPDGSPKNRNDVMFLEDIFASPVFKYTHTHRAMANVLTALNEYCDAELEHKHSAMADLGNGFHWKTLLSGYKDGGKYDIHRDGSIASCLWWVGNDYTGGNLHFPDLDLEFESKEFTGIVFPSFYRHAVRDIASDRKDEFVRYTVSGFLNYFYE